MCSRCYGFEVKAYNGISNLLVSTSTFESLEDAVAFALNAAKNQKVTIAAWDNLRGQWHPMMKRTAEHHQFEGCRLPPSPPTLIPLFGRANG